MAHPLDILTYHRSPINKLANQVYKIAVEIHPRDKKLFIKSRQRIMNLFKKMSITKKMVKLTKQPRKLL